MSDDPALTPSYLRRPRVRADIVRRPRLLERLGDPPDEVILVCAPAGFGKTTLVLDWLSQQSLPHAWLSLDAMVSDGRGFLACLHSAIQRIEPSFDLVEWGGPSAAHASISQVRLAALSNAIASLGIEFILVLDDYHTINSEEAHDILRFLVEHIPPNLHLVVISRVDPPLPISRMRVHQTLVEVRERDLKFSLSEVRAFFAARVVETLTDEQLRTLTDRTEGWAAALQLAAISLIGSGDPRTTIESFAGTQRLILDYLLDEVFGLQDASMQNFLLKTSILARFNEDVCRTVTGQANAAECLRRAEHENLFLTPIDDRLGWFRYHHLFAELLQHRLAQTLPEEVDDLHARASKWYEDHGYVQDAFLHARQVSSRNLLLELLDRHCFDLLKGAQLANFARWVEDVDIDQLAPYPRLLTGLAWLRLLTTRAPDLDHLLDLAEESLSRSDLEYHELEHAELRGQAETARAFQLRFADQLHQSVAASRRAIEGPFSANPVVRGLLLFNLARNHMRLGEMAEALAALEESTYANERSGNNYLLLESAGHAGAVIMQLNGVPAALGRLELASSELTTAGLSGLPAFGIIVAHLGRAHLLANRLDVAAELLERATRLGAEGNEPDVHGNALVVTAGVHIARGQINDARKALEELGSIVRSSGIRPFETRADVEFTRLALHEGDLVSVGIWLEQYRDELNEYRVDREAAALLAAQACVYLREHERGRSIAERLRREAGARGRGLTCLQADLVLCLTQPHASSGEPWWRILDTAMRCHYLRPILDWGMMAAPHLEHASARAPSSEARAFASRLLSILSDDRRRAAAKPAFLQPLDEPLTSREQEVLYHAARSLSNREIADRLYVSVDTVKTHLKHVYAKLNATSRREAVRLAREAGLAIPPEQAGA